MAHAQPTSTQVGVIKLSTVARAGRPPVIRARICLGADPQTGKLVYREKYGDTKKEATKAAQDFLKDWDWSTIRPAKPDRTIVSGYLDGWLAQGEESWAPGTLATFRSRVKRINHYLGDMELLKVDIPAVRDLLTDMKNDGVPTPTRAQTLLTLRQALNAAVNDELLSKNPAAKVAPPKYAKKEVEAPAPEETAALLAAVVGEPWEYVVHVALGTAFRVGEIMGLQWQDIDWDNREIVLRRHIVNASGQLYVQPGTKKNPDKSWRLPMTDSVARALRAQRDKQVFDAMPKKGRKRWQGPPAGAPEGWVFPNLIGKHMNPLKISEWFRGIADGIGQEEKTFHHLRHDAASYLLSAGVPLEIVSKLLRHAQISLTLKTYAHLLRRVEHSAMAELDRVLEGAIG